nr:aldehyde dehydrogenase family protein [Nocardia sp. BMG51109]
MGHLLSQLAGARRGCGGRNSPTATGAAPTAAITTSSPRLSPSTGKTERVTECVVAKDEPRTSELTASLLPTPSRTSSTTRQQHCQLAREALHHRHTPHHPHRPPGNRVRSGVHGRRRPPGGGHRQPGPHGAGVGPYNRYSNHLPLLPRRGTCVVHRSEYRRCSGGFQRHRRAGAIWVTTSTSKTPPAAEWGGYGRSGNGRELGPGGLAEYQETKHIWHNTVPKAGGWLTDT